MRANGEEATASNVFAGLLFIETEFPLEAGGDDILASVFPLT